MYPFDHLVAAKYRGCYVCRAVERQSRMAISMSRENQDCVEKQEKYSTDLTRESICHLKLCYCADIKEGRDRATERDGGQAMELKHCPKNLKCFWCIYTSKTHYFNSTIKEIDK